MKLENYNIYLEKTADSYSKKVKKYLVKKFLHQGIVSNKGGYLKKYAALFYEEVNEEFY